MEKKSYQINNFGRKTVFASFLPGVCGIKGTSLWCYYVNRGQAVACFGVADKDHSIMEFSPAHQAYQNVKRTGFRTFVKKNGSFLEPFSDENKETSMFIYKNGLELEEKDAEENLLTKVRYFTLPEEKIGSLVRKLVIKNTGSETVKLEVLDGMPACIPYGIDLESLKLMGQLMKAWMQVEEVETRVPFFKVRASTADSAAVTMIDGGNFSLGFGPDGVKLAPIVNPDLVFGYDVSLGSPVAFQNESLSAILEKKQIVNNIFPCSFYGMEKELAPGKELVLYEMIGQAENRDILNTFLEKELTGDYLEAKWERAHEITEEFCDEIGTVTANADFDEYCRYTYMDNVLRGGYPIRLGNDKTFYVYSRKHGDLEREYNYFKLLPEYYTQGNGNFRDVNQNRRCDVFFHPEIGTENIVRFYSFCQLDGYNPLGVDKVTYYLDESDAEAVAGSCEELAAFLQKPFTPGEVYRKMDALGMPDAVQDGLFEIIIDKAKGVVNGSFLEGYWSDHWTYNLDLIENYLDVFPEQEKALLYETPCTCFVSQVNINPRKKRYEVTENGLRQYHALDEASLRETEEKLLYTQNGKGEIFTQTLMEKLILINTLKFCALDAWGMGVEMEGGKPGWYDALNGLPGLFGSSMAETYELERNLVFTKEILQKYSDDVMILKELSDLMEKVLEIVEQEKQPLFAGGEVLSFWNRINDEKEAYRAKTFAGIEGDKKAWGQEVLLDYTEKLLAVVKEGIKKAAELCKDTQSAEDGTVIVPTYFAFKVHEYEVEEDGIRPKHFEPVLVPAFLEGPVRYLKTDCSMTDKEKLYQAVKGSDLYDRPLNMYKVNASLNDASYELGRARVFTPGWLENESIWLHMEYKYLLELLKSGMFKEFTEDFEKAAIPFLDPEKYGRSIYENSSFLVSSNNPNPDYHGRGFVARLSGSTVEFIQMWKIMMFGKNPFLLENGSLTLQLAPVIPAYLLDEKKQIEAVFMGKTKVCYKLEDADNWYPGDYSQKEAVISWKDGSETKTVKIAGAHAEAVRDGKAEKITVYLNRTV